MSRTIIARQLMTSAGMLEYPLLTVDDGILADVRGLSHAEYERLAAKHRFLDATVVPSFVDVHIHGCAGQDVMLATQEGMRTICAFLARHGVGAFLPTTVTSPEDEILYALSCIAKEIQHSHRNTRQGAVPLGIHLEGPFLSHAKRGVHTSDLLQLPSIELFDRLWQAAEGHILLMTIAPELPGALDLIAHASALGVRCSLGHSDATFPEARAGYLAGAVSATHTFNAMRSLDHRDPGLTTFVLDEDSLFAEVIADGLHVDPAIVRLFLKAKGPDRAVLVTDGISATGMPDGRYKLGDMDVDVIEGRCTSGGAIAGSTLTLDQGVRNFMKFTGSGLSIAARAASTNPAKLIGRESAWGSLEVGRPANFTVLSTTGEVVETFLQGVPAIHTS